MSSNISDDQLNELARLTGQSVSQLGFYARRLLDAADLVHSGLDLPPAELFRLEGIGQLLLSDVSKAQEGEAICALLNSYFGFTEDAPKLECQWDVRRDKTRELVLHTTMPTAPVYPS